MALALEDLAKIVAAAKFDQLVGEVEGQFFDVKSQPYKFSQGLDAKREFAKDVAAFANAQGGFVLIGLTTKTSTLSYGEEVDAVHPIPKNLLDIGQHIDLLQEWLYPQPVGVDVKFVAFGPDVDKGVMVVFVPPQNERSQPFLLTKTVTDKKSTDVILAYVERRLDFTDARTVVELHHALRVGLNLERELLGRMDNFEALMTQHFKEAQQTEDVSQASTRLQDRIARLLKEGE